MIRLEEFFPDIPRPGWPGRRRAIARELFRVALEFLTWALILVALLGTLVLIAAGTDRLP